MIISGTILRVDESEGDHHKFSRYLLIQTESGKVGIQVRAKEARKNAHLLSENTEVEAEVHFEHSASKSNNGKGRTFYHNNIILNEIL
jgi:tRNA U34 2-thiouridine synthase MnmA/TrmU